MGLIKHTYKFPEGGDEDYSLKGKYLNDANRRMNETVYSSLVERRRLYAEIVNEYYKEKKARAKVQAWWDKQNKKQRKTGK